MKNAAWFDRMQALGKRARKLMEDVKQALEDDQQDSDELFEASECLEQACSWLGIEIDRSHAEMNRR